MGDLPSQCVGGKVNVIHVCKYVDFFQMQWTSFPQLPSLKGSGGQEENQSTNSSLDQLKPPNPTLPELPPPAGR